jgi:hypothetical protein
LALASNSPPGQIHYTLDGTTPNSRSPLYTAPLTLTNTTIVKAIATGLSAGDSPVAAVALFVAIGPSNGLSGFGGNGSGWTLNGGASVTNDLLILTDGSQPEARSAFYDSPQSIDTFHVQFVYRASGSADGVTFALQNATEGAHALGHNQSGLGFYSIAPSAAVEMNICNCTGAGTLFATNGATGYPTGYISTSPVNLASGDPIWVILDYDGSRLAESLVDLVSGDVFSTNYIAQLPEAVGGMSMAYVGFTGSDGDAHLSSTQTISDFTMGPAEPNPTLSAVFSGAQIIFSWPPSALSYALKSTTNLSTPVQWQPVHLTPAISGTEANVSVPLGATNMFFRLQRQ